MRQKSQVRQVQTVRDRELKMDPKIVKEVLDVKLNN